MAELPTLLTACTPRPEILKGSMVDDPYMADLGLVVESNAPKSYQDPAVFFRNTYPTEGLRTVARETFTRLSGKGAGSPVLRLETSLGGGKTHTLIALYHLATNPEACPAEVSEILGKVPPTRARVVAIIGTDLSVTPTESSEPRTIWGYLAQKMDNWGPKSPLWESDRKRIAPGKSDLQEVLGSKPILLLMDELAEYLVKASAVDVGEQSNLAEQCGAFLQELTQAVAALPRACLVITTLRPDDPFGEGTKEIHQTLDKSIRRIIAQEAKSDSQVILSRLERPITPTGPTEFAAVVRHRLFERVDPDAAEQVARAYASSLQRPEVRDKVVPHAIDPKYLETLRDAYPFHPELIQILRTKTSSIQSFNQTRGVLRLLSAVLRTVWKDAGTPLLIHPFHIDLSDSTTYEELVSRLNKGEYRSALTADLIDPKGTPRARPIDESFSEPWGSRLITTTFLHSLVGYVAPEVRKGATEPDLILACYRPGDDPKTLENALKSLEETCFYFVRSGPYFVVSTEPSLNLVVKNAQDIVRQTAIKEELEDRIDRLFGSRRFFEPRLFANEPSKVPDDTGKPKLTVIHFNDATAKATQGSPPPEVAAMYGQSGSQGKPRLYPNNVVFLVADAAEIEKMQLKTREFLALQSLTAAGSVSQVALNLSPTQRNALEGRKKECDLYAKVAIALAYRHLYVPSARRTESSSLRHLVLRATEVDVTPWLKAGESEERYLVEFLVAQGVARTADESPLSPDFVLESLWPKNQDSMGADEFKRLFYTHPEAGIHFSEDLISRTLRAGLEKGTWFATSEGRFFDKTNTTQFAGGFLSTTQVVLADSAEGRRLWGQFNCPECGKRLTSCTCKERVPLCENCGKPVHPGPCRPGDVMVRTVVPPLPQLEVQSVKLERAARDLEARCKDQKISSVAGIDFHARTREGLLKLTSAFPQLHPATITVKIDATISHEHTGGNHLQIVYRGDLQGFNSIKTVVSNYEARTEFDRRELWVEVRFLEPKDPTEVLEMLRRKVGPFTEESLFDVALIQQTTVEKGPPRLAGIDSGSG